jgi:hypothetical protein
MQRLPAVLSAGAVGLALLYFPTKGMSANAFISRDALDVCVNDQKANIQNNGVPDEIIVRYCVCTTDNLSKVVTEEELKMAAHTAYENLPADLRARVYTAGLSCLQEIRTRCVRDSASHVTCK